MMFPTNPDCFLLFPNLSEIVAAAVAVAWEHPVSILSATVTFSTSIHLSPLPLPPGPDVSCLSPGQSQRPPTSSAYILSAFLNH